MSYAILTSDMPESQMTLPSLGQHKWLLTVSPTGICGWIYTSECEAEFCPHYSTNSPASSGWGEGRKTYTECKYLWIVFLSLNNWYRYGNTPPKVFHEWQPLRGSLAHVLTKAFWCVWGRVKSHRTGSHVLGPLFDRRFVAGWAKLLNTAAFAAVL